MEPEDSLEIKHGFETHEQPKAVIVKKESPSPEKSNHTKHTDPVPVKSHSDINP